VFALAPPFFDINGGAPTAVAIAILSAWSIFSLTILEIGFRFPRYEYLSTLFWWWQRSSR
jgi:hypothetical protein